MKSQPITRRWTELSAYMDGQLPENKAARLEKRLSRDSELRAEYEDLQRTRKMLRGLPPRRVPRNFTLTPDMVRAPRRRRSGFLVPALRFSSSFAAFMLVLTFALDFMGSTLKMGTMAQDAAPAPAMEMMMEEAPAEMAADEEPMILLWDEQPEPGLASGIATGEEAPMADAASEGEALAEAMPMEEAAPAAEAPMPAAEAEEETVLAMEVPAAPAEEAPAANAAQPVTPTAAPLGTERVAAEEEAPLEKAFTADEAHDSETIDTAEDSIILGIPPEEEQGQIQITEPPTTAPLLEQRGFMPARRWLQIGLGIFAIVAMLISFLIPRKRR